MSSVSWAGIWGEKRSFGRKIYFCQNGYISHVELLFLFRGSDAWQIHDKSIHIKTQLWTNASVFRKSPTVLCLPLSHLTSSTSTTFVNILSKTTPPFNSQLAIHLYTSFLHILHRTFYIYYNSHYISFKSTYQYQHHLPHCEELLYTHLAPAYTR